MALHTLTDERTQRPAACRVRKNGLLQLGWPHFWLLAGILGLGLALLVLILFVPLASI
jgi:hypothetical protein